MTRRILASSILLALAVGAPFAAIAGEQANRTPQAQVSDSAIGTAACGHVADLMAAQRALRAGEREEALRHLKEARRLLATCGERLGQEVEAAAADAGLVSL